MPLTIIATSWLIVLSDTSLVPREKLKIPRFTTGRLFGASWSPERRDRRAIATALALNGVPDRRVAAIVRGVAGDVPDAADAMETLARESGRSASLWSDASALRLEQSLRLGDSGFALDALAFADRAIAIEPSPEAFFNRGVALQTLGLDRPAIASYLQASIGSTDGWSAEILSRIASLKRAPAPPWSSTKMLFLAAVERHDAHAVREIVSAFPQQARTWAEGECLATWAVQVGRGNAGGAARYLDVARATGAALRLVNGDELLSDIVVAIERNASSRNAVIRAYELYARGRAAYAKGDNARGADDLESSARVFDRAVPPMRIVAHYFAVSARFESGAVAGALEELRELRRRVPDRYLSLRAQIDWEIGTVLARRGSLEDALDAYRRSLEGFERLHEEAYAARMRTFCGRMLNLMGCPLEASRIRASSLAVASRHGDEALLEVLLGEMALDELADRRWDRGRALLEVAIRSVPPSNPRRRFDILLWHSLITAPADFHPPQVALTAIMDVGLRANAENDLRFAVATDLRSRDPTGALQLFSSCIEYAKTDKNALLMLPHVFLGRARAWADLGVYENAVADAEAAVRVFEQRRAAIGEVELRDAFFGTAAQAFDDLIYFHWRRGDTRAILDAAERRRGRIFLDEAGGAVGSLRPLTTWAIAPRIPTDTAILVFTTIGERVLATFLTRTNFDVHTVSQKASALENLVTRLRRQINNSESLSAAEELFALLAAPFADGLRDARRLVVVADRPLDAVPFAALRDGRTGSYLVETVEIVRAPSVSFYVQASRVAVARDPHAVVALGDPAFAPVMFPMLPRLPGAAAEAAEVAHGYDHAVVLTEGGATYRNLAAVIGTAGAVHIATHGLMNSRDPGTAELILASDGEESGACGIPSLADLPLKKGALVFLAGCQTATRGEGHGDLRDLAAPFLAAGAASVVATQGDIDDDLTRPFAVAFHQKLRAGRSAAAALRAVQTAMIHSSSRTFQNPKAWALVEVYGTGM